MAIPQGCSDADILVNHEELKRAKEIIAFHNPNLFKPPKFDTTYFFYTEVKTEYGSSLER